MSTERFSRPDRLCAGLASLFGTGHVPLGSGTAGALLALPVFLLIKDPQIFFLCAVLLTVLAFLVSSRAERVFGEKDSKKIVIDDFAGMLVALIYVPHEMRFVVPAFFLFRAFDMVKIWPADRVEKLPGAFGVVGDDLVAGLYALAVLQIARLFV